MATTLKSTLTILALLGAMLPAVHAATIYTVTAANGATAEADFTFGANSLTLVLKNTTVNPPDFGFDLSAFQFVLAGATGAMLTNASSPNARTVNSDTTYTDSGPVTGVANVGWIFSNSLNTYVLDVYGTGGAGPKDTLIGSPAADNKYDAANPSLTNGVHSPYLALMATFTFTFTGGVDSSTIPSAASFDFNTGSFVAGACQSGCGGLVPEPASVVLGGSGLLALALLLRRSRA